MQNTQPARIQWTSVMILVAELVVIAAAVFTIFTQIPEKNMQYTSVSLFISVTVGLRLVKPISRNKLVRYAMASVVTLVFILIAQLF